MPEHRHKTRLCHQIINRLEESARPVRASGRRRSHYKPMTKRTITNEQYHFAHSVPCYVFLCFVMQSSSGSLSTDIGTSSFIDICSLPLPFLSQARNEDDEVEAWRNRFFAMF